MSSRRRLPAVPWDVAIGIAIVVVVLGLSAAILFRPAVQLPDRHFDQGGIAFDFPSGWAVYDQMPVTLGFGQPVAVLGTVPWGPCGTSDLNCHYEVKLAPGQIEVDVANVFIDGLCPFAIRPDLDQAGPGEPPRRSFFVRVNGRPAIRTEVDPGERDYSVSDAWRTWRVAKPGTTQFLAVIDAKVRGPGVPQSLAALDRLIASLVLQPDVDVQANGPVDCGAPFPAAGASQPSGDLPSSSP